MLKRHSFFLFSILTFVYVLMSSATWFAQLLPSTPVVILAIIGMSILILPLIDEIRIDTKIITLVILVILFGVWSGMILGLVRGIYNMLCFIPAIFLYMLPTTYKEKLLTFTTKWFAIFVAFGLCIYAITFVFNLPPPLGFFIKENNDFYPTFANYFFYIKPLYGYVEYFRFNGFALEPGHLAISSIFFLGANNFDFKKNLYTKILLLGIIISFSLAGYVLLFCGWALLRMKNMSGIIVSIFFVLALYLGAQVYNNGDNYVNNLIFERLEVDEEKGIEGNNRTNDRTDSMFNNLIQSEQILTGMPNAENMRVFGAGYKKYLLHYGLISILLVLLLYWNLKSPLCNKRYGIGMFILVFITWCDCEYPTWYTWILPYVLGTGIIQKDTTPIKPSQKQLS